MAFLLLLTGGTLYDVVLSTDTVASSDVVGVGYDILVQPTDTQNSTDAFLVSPLTLSDTIAGSTDQILTSPPVFAETLAATDTVAATLVYHRIVSDTAVIDADIDNTMEVTPQDAVLQTDAVIAVRQRPTIVSRDVTGSVTNSAFREAIYGSRSRIENRNIFVKRGPIARAPLTLQSGSTTTIVNADTLTLVGAALSSSALGKYVQLMGNGLNVGSFRISAVLAPTKVRVQANFRLPDTNALTWKVYDPRTGEISDDPADVTVRVNGTPVVPDAVIGLLGQIILPYIYPQPLTDDIKVDYRYIRNPTVEVRRLNSMEFRLNSWDDVGAQANTGHVYRYNNVLIDPANFETLDVQAHLNQPEQRGLKYRAYERAYTPLLNDPNLLELNATHHKVAYPELVRGLESTFVSYTATALPENDPSNPWTSYGQGTASLVGGALTVADVSTGPYPGGQPKFWMRSADFSFDHIFAASWRLTLTSNPILQGVYTGVSAGYANGKRAFILGYLVDGGVKKIGILKPGYGNDPSDIAAWTGGIDGDGAPTGAPATLDWSTTHSYRILRDNLGTIKILIDGDFVETLRTTEADIPFLSELDDPFDKVNGVFFGSLSRPATNTSTWEFFRYSIQPSNSFESATSFAASFEGSTTPETASEPWTPIGYAGTERVDSSVMVLDSYSALDDPSLLNGGFRGFTRIEPLLSSDTDIVLDIAVQLKSHTHDYSNKAVMAAIDDGDRLTQLAFISDTKAPKISYGGHGLPTSASWETMGSQSAEMRGRLLRISDTSSSDGRIYYAVDNEVDGPSRILSTANDYTLEFRVKVNSYTTDVDDFAGVSADVYDGSRALGVLLKDNGRVCLHSEGVDLASFDFEWFDGQPHTYRLVRNGFANLVTLFADGVFLGSLDYTDFTVVSSGGTAGIVSFGSTTPVSTGALSNTDWFYANVWRVQSSEQRFVGIWKGTEHNSLLDYHLSTKTRSTALATGTQVIDNNIDYNALGVVAGDYVLVDTGLNQGVYRIDSATQHTLTLQSPFPYGPAAIEYRIPSQTNWSAPHRYRLVHSGTNVSLFLDETVTPILRVGYDELNLPASHVGLPHRFTSGYPSVSFGTFDAEELSQSSWDFVRYTVSQFDTEKRIAPHHDIINQRNVMASPEHLFTDIAHNHTNYWSSSTGVLPQTDPDFLQDPDLIAYTLLNEGTPLVPKTQTYEVRNPQVVSTPVSGLNLPEDVLNNDRDFTLNDDRTVYSLVVPNDVLYNSLQVIETSTGSKSLITPVHDDFPQLGTLRFQNKVCAVYNGSTLPENATPAWSLVSADPTHAIKSSLYGILTYGTDSIGTRTVYHNPTPLVRSPGMPTEVKFRAKILNDTSKGLGDTLARFGLNGLGAAVSVAFITSPLGERYVLIVDQATHNVLAGLRFDYLDGLYHTYKIVRDPAAQTIRLLVEEDSISTHYKRVRIADAVEVTEAPLVTGVLTDHQIPTTDSVSRTASYLRTLADSGSTTDAVFAQLNLTPESSDSGSTTDSVTLALGYLRNLVDTPSLTDSVAITAERSPFDIIANSDTVETELTTDDFDWGFVLAMTKQGKDPSFRLYGSTPYQLTHVTQPRWLAYISGKVRY